MAQEDPAGDERLYVPDPDESQLTFRAILAGCLIGGVVSAMNIYFGLRTGWSIGGSLIAAILGYSTFAALRPKNAYTPLEANITQTAGSAAGSMTSAAGLLAAIPALGMLGTKLSWIELVLWALAVAYLGVFFAVPLRRQMVLVEKLRFPTGTATAETIMAMFSGGGDAIEKSRTLVRWAIVAAVFTIAAYFVPQLGMPPIEAGFLGVAAAWGFKLLISPLMGGAGILIGMRVAASLALGAVVSWALLGPYVQHQGWAPGGIMSYEDGARGWILWPGVAIMVSDALTRLVLSWRTILNTFKMSRGGDPDVKDTAPDTIPNSWWIGGLVISTALTTIAAKVVFDIPPHFTLIAVALSSVLAMIAVRSTGETDINPIGGMGKVTQLVYGGLAPGAMTTNLMAAAITGAGASQAGDMMQDLKTGHLLGASPRGQFKAQLIGIAAGVFFCVPIYKLFDTAYEIGGEEIPAPAAHAWKAMAVLLSKGFDALPPHATAAVIAGVVFGAVMAVLGTWAPAGVKKFLPSGLAFGIAFIVPAYYSIAMFVGALIFAAYKQSNASRAEKLGFSIASGLIAGEGLMGIVTAVLTLLGIDPLF
ncbi:MAG: OPT/YSL family transporter [Alphaproteobacteria bacterium]|nr:OPT/YSL family transporter [Alphaproteobacteria bacterium]